MLTHIVVTTAGAVHGFAAVLGGRFENAPHGAVCACLLPFVFEKNAQCLQEKATAGDAGNLLLDPARLDALVRFKQTLNSDITTPKSCF